MSVGLVPGTGLLVGFLFHFATSCMLSVLRLKPCTQWSLPPKQTCQCVCCRFTGSSFPSSISTQPPQSWETKSNTLGLGQGEGICGYGHCMEVSQSQVWGENPTALSTGVLSYGSAFCVCTELVDALFGPQVGSSFCRC